MRFHVGWDRMVIGSGQVPSALRRTLPIKNPWVGAPIAGSRRITRSGHHTL